MQIDVTRIILVYVIQGILVIFFSSITYQILRRKRQRLNLIFSGFFISIILGNIFNMIYAPFDPVEYESTIIFLNFLTNFFLFFGLIFILVVHMIILESTIVFSVKRQNRYITIYGILLFFGMLILVIFFQGVEISPNGYPQYNPLFFVYVVSVLTGFALIPIHYTSWKIYHSFETKALKRKWRFYIAGSLGLTFFNLYPILVSNLLNYFIDNSVFRSLISILGISIILWGFMMYYGIGSKLKQ